MAVINGTPKAGSGSSCQRTESLPQTQQKSHKKNILLEVGNARHKTWCRQTKPNPHEQIDNKLEIGEDNEPARFDPEQGSDGHLCYFAIKHPDNSPGVSDHKHAVSSIVGMFVAKLVTHCFLKLGPNTFRTTHISWFQYHST